MEQFRSHLDHRLPPGMAVSGVPGFLSTDATVTTGRVGVNKTGDNCYNMLHLKNKVRSPIWRHFKVKYASSIQHFQWLGNIS